MRSPEYPQWGDWSSRAEGDLNVVERELLEVREDAHLAVAAGAELGAGDHRDERVAVKHQNGVSASERGTISSIATSSCCRMKSQSCFQVCPLTGQVEPVVYQRPVPTLIAAKS